MIQLVPLEWLYISLTSWVGLGLLLGYVVPAKVPQLLGKFLFWIGVPFSIMAFLRQADLSTAVWRAPVAAWVAILMGAGLAGLWIKLPGLTGSIRVNKISQIKPDLKPTSHTEPATAPASLRATQGSFLLSAMVGNTGYLGYPVVLALTGPEYFGWAVFYDTLGTVLGAYGLGVMLAAYFGKSDSDSPDFGKPGFGKPEAHLAQMLEALVRNPALWSFGLGLGLRNLALPQMLEQGLHGAAWSIVGLSLLLLGMRLSQIRAWHNLKQAAISLSIKMLIVPLVIGLILPYFGIDGLIRLVIVLQAGMPPAFATLVIAEAYNLDRQLTVTTLALGSVALLLLLPVWLWLFWPS